MSMSSAAAIERGAFQFPSQSVTTDVRQARSTSTSDGPPSTILAVSQQDELAGGARLFVGVRRPPPRPDRLLRGYSITVLGSAPRRRPPGVVLERSRSPGPHGYSLSLAWAIPALAAVGAP